MLKEDEVFNSGLERGKQGTCIDETGPWPFITRRVFRSEGRGDHVWSSRHHRKALHGVYRPATVWLWMPEKLNWWIGLIFAVGATLFAVASLLSLSPVVAEKLSLNSAAAGTFFAGSIPFTIAAYLQLFQAANAPVHSKKSSLHFFGWQPQNIGWLSSALQFVGTLLFNVNTLNGLLDPSGWMLQEMVIWSPNRLGIGSLFGVGLLGVHRDLPPSLGVSSERPFMVGRRDKPNGLHQLHALCPVRSRSSTADPGMGRCFPCFHLRRSTLFFNRRTVNVAGDRTRASSGLTNRKRPPTFFFLTNSQDSRKVSFGHSRLP